jgi:hypothetical protein
MSPPFYSFCERGAKLDGSYSDKGQGRVNTQLLRNMSKGHKTSKSPGTEGQESLHVITRILFFIAA